MIKTEELTKYFDDFLAVSQVNIEVHPGEVLALLGPNGAGKTTTVRLLTSILRASSGKAYVAGYDIEREPDKVRAAVGVLTEQHGLYLRMKGLEYLDFYGELYGLDAGKRRERARSLAERFDLGQVLDKRLGEYSKGMRQKLALVRSMLHDPPVLLLDEPTSAMDPLSARLVRDAINDLRGDGRTIMICTHNLPEAEELADRIAIIRHGKIVAEGTNLSLKARLLGAPLIELRVTHGVNGLADELAGLVEVVSQGHNWLRFRSPEPAVSNPEVVKKLSELGVGVITLSEVPQSLEDVYLRVVAEGVAA
nr:ABC transporter ATP-binding protein [Anaerolineae bacterium]